MIRFVFALVLGLSATVALAAEKETVKAEGKTACAHCEYGIDEGGCGLAVKDKAGKIFVLKGEGEAFKKFLKERGDGAAVKFTGTKVAEKKAGDVAYTVVDVKTIEAAANN